MDIPKRILVGSGPSSNGTSNRNHLPADYYSDDDDDFDYDIERYSPPRPKLEPTATLMTPPGKLTIPEIGDEERRRYMRDSSLNNLEGVPVGGAGHDDSMYRTPNDTLLRNLNSFQAGDPISVAKQVRHLHNRVRLLEDELQAQHTRQIYIIGVLSVYLISRTVRWMYR